MEQGRYVVYGHSYAHRFFAMFCWSLFSDTSYLVRVIINWNVEGCAELTGQPRQVLITHKVIISIFVLKTWGRERSERSGRMGKLSVGMVGLTNCLIWSGGVWLRNPSGGHFWWWSGSVGREGIVPPCWANLCYVGPFFLHQTIISLLYLCFVLIAYPITMI